MKVRWLNNDCTEAIVTRGWFREQEATVKMTASGFGRWGQRDDPGEWKFHPSGIDCDNGLRHWLWARRKSALTLIEQAKRAGVWVDVEPTGELPEARLLSQQDSFNTKPLP